MIEGGLPGGASLYPRKPLNFAVLEPELLGKATDFAAAADGVPLWDVLFQGFASPAVTRT